MIRLQMNMTLDGFVADAEGRLDWMLGEDDPQHVAFLTSLAQGIETIIMGRKMAEVAIPHWQQIAESSAAGAEADYARMFTETKKLVFSISRKTLPGKNVSVGPDLFSEMSKLKADKQSNAMVYGGAGLVSSMISGNLIDEMNIFIHPATVGTGLTIFPTKANFKLSEAESYSNGIIRTRYRP